MPPVTTKLASWQLLVFSDWMYIYCLPCQVQGDLVQVDSTGIRPHDNIQIVRQGLFYTVRLIKEQVEVRWDGGRDTGLPWQQGSWGQHGAHLGPTGPRWAPCWPHELCYLGWKHFPHYWPFVKGIHQWWIPYTSLDVLCHKHKQAIYGINTLKHPMLQAWIHFNSLRRFYTSDCI